MSTIRVAKRQRFAVIDRRAIRDRRLSWGARGLLGWMLDQPDDAELSRDEIVKEAPEGEHRVRGYLQELTIAGYLQRERRQDDRGRFFTETTLYEVPPLGDSPPAVSPPLGDSPQADSPPVEDRPVRDGRPTEGTTPNGVGTANAERSEVFKAVAEVWSGKSWPFALSDKSRGYIASALPELAELGATASDVHLRAEVYRQTYDKRPTPAALVKHWPSLDATTGPPSAPTLSFAERRAAEESARLASRAAAEALAAGADRELAP